MNCICELYLNKAVEYLSKKELWAPGIMVRVFNPSNWEAKAGGSQVQRWPGQYSKFKASLSYTVRPFVKQNKAK
jgi:hypothetical protein